MSERSLPRPLTRRQFLTRAAAVSAGLVGSSALAACAPQTDAPGAATEPQIVKETVEITKEITAVPESTALTLWHHWGGTREPLMDKAFEDFCARNPGYTVEHTVIPWDRKEETVLTAVAAGGAPDVLMLNSSEMPPYALNNALNPIDELVQHAGIEAGEVYESDWKAASYAGKMWGLPQTVGGSAFLLFYNKQAFEEAGLDPAMPPETWSESLAAAKALLQSSGDSIERLGLSPGTDSWSWLNYLAQNEALWLSEDGREVLMDNEGAVEALQWLVDVIDAQGGQEKVAAFTSAAGESDPFMSGRAAMVFQGVWQYYLVQTNAPDLEYGSAMAPNNKGPWHEANYGPHLYVLPANTKQLPQAWKLALWMTREAGGCDFLTAQLRPSPWKQCNDDSPVSMLADYWPVVLSALEATRSEPLTPLFNHFASIWDEMVQSATMHQQGAAEAVAWGAAEMARVNEEYWSKQG